MKENFSNPEIEILTYDSEVETGFQTASNFDIGSDDQVNWDDLIQ